MSHYIEKAVVIGATGLTGKKLVHALQALPSCQNIRIIVRRESAEFAQLPKVEQIIQPDFMQTGLTDVDGASHIFSCLGTTIKKAGSKTAFRHIDYDMNAHVGQLSAQTGAHFVLISAIGADASSMFFYNRVKGELEEHLKTLPFKKLSILRPSLLLGERGESRLLEDLSQGLFRKVSQFVPESFRYTPVTAEQVAHTMVVVAQSQTEKIEIYDNLHIQQTK